MEPREQNPRSKIRDNEDPRPDLYHPATGADERIDEKAEQEARDEAHPATEARRLRPEDGTE